jgi:CO dehydrogenase/acetyl-CoA synthase alpha subunit
LLELKSRPLRIEFLYFVGCPHAATARLMVETCLKRLGLELPIDDKEGDYPSPTILIDGEDVTGAAPASGRTCRLDVPTEAQVLSALQKAASGD